jgi:pimeloyl-[acyl-carrier protein] methyl ester esterase
MSSSLIFKSIGHGQTLVFIHGWGLNSGVWQPLAEKLSEHYQVITIDLPGFGLNTENTLEEYTLAKVSAQIANTISTPAVYIGWSLGGLVATNIAINHPEKTQGLITIASSPCFEEKVLDETNGDEKLNNWPGIKANVLTLFHQQLGDNIQKTLDGFLKIQAMGSPHIRQDIKQLRDLIMAYPLPSQETLDRSLTLLSSEDLRSQLNQIQIPFLRLYGKLDSLVPKTAIPHINQLAPNSDYSIFDKASHAPFISHFDEFYQKLTQWLDQYFK